MLTCVDKQADRRDERGQQLHQFGSPLRSHIARTLAIEDEADCIGTSLDSGSDVSFAGQAADLDTGSVHGLVQGKAMEIGQLLNPGSRQPVHRCRMVRDLMQYIVVRSDEIEPVRGECRGRQLAVARCQHGCEPVQIA